MDVIGTFLNSAREHGDALTHVETRLEVEDVVPDAYLVVEHQGHEYHLFIELEVGTSSGPRFRSKLQRYDRVYRSGKWTSLWDTWPYTLFVSLEEQFEERLRRASDPAVSIEHFFSTLPILKTMGPFGKAWKDHISNERKELP